MASISNPEICCCSFESLAPVIRIRLRVLQEHEYVFRVSYRTYTIKTV